MKRIEAVAKREPYAEWRVQTTAGKDDTGVLAVKLALQVAIPGIKVSGVHQKHAASLIVSGVWRLEWDRIRSLSIDELNQTLNETPYLREGGVVIHPPHEVHVTMTFPVTDELMAYARRLEGVTDVGRAGTYDRTLSLYMPGRSLDANECERVRKYMSFEF